MDTSSASQFFTDLGLLSSTGLMDNIFDLLENTSGWLDAAFSLAGLL